MEILIDNEPLEFTYERVSSLAQLLSVLSKEVNNNHRIILEIKVDGQVLDGMEDPRIGKMNLSDVAKLEISTENPRVLSIHILYECAKHIGKISHGLESVAEEIQSRREQQAFDRLQEALGAWIEINEGISNAATVLGIDFDEFLLKGDPLKTVQQDIQKSLNEAAQTLQEENYLEFSDILEFDLAPKLQNIQEGLYRIITVSEKKLH